MGACSCNRSVLVSLLWGSLHLYFCCVLLQKRGLGGGGEGRKGLLCRWCYGLPTMLSLEGRLGVGVFPSNPRLDSVRLPSSDPKRLLASLN